MFRYLRQFRERNANDVSFNQPPSCDGCRDRLNLSWSYLWVDAAKMIEASKAGCPTCLIVCTALTQFDPTWTEDVRVNIRLFRHPRPGVEVLSPERTLLRLEFYASSEIKLLPHNARFEFKALAGLPKMLKPPSLVDSPSIKLLRKVREFSTFWAAFDVAPKIEENPSSRKSLQRVSRWLKHCIRSHPQCGSAQLLRLPARVIDVNPFDPGKPKACRLYETRGESVEYITLSHCWGADPSIIPQTTKASLQERCKSIDVDRLSKTFKDAIEVTRALGIKYIWIDSLCIIQDDSADWDSQSREMRTIYQNSYLTIAAAASKDGTGGLFTDHEARICEIPWPKLVNSNSGSSDGTLEDYPILCRRRRPHECLKPGLTADPITSRAWAYQERLLSGRVIHYTSEELVWECRETRACECGLNDEDAGLAKAQFEKRVRTVNNYPTSTLRGHLKKDQIQSVTRGWHDIISTYTTLNLTFDDDIFPALSGIARELILNDEYLAGLRKQYLVEDLNWRVETKSTLLSLNLSTKGRPAHYRAPSWSWASVKAPIQYLNITPTSFENANVTICKAKCTPATGDRFGKISKGYLFLEGFVITAKVDPWLDSQLGIEWATVSFDSMDEIEAMANGSGLLLFIICVEDFGQNCRITALMLKESEKGDGSYQRIGIAESGIGLSFLKTGAEGGKVSEYHLGEVFERRKVKFI